MKTRTIFLTMCLALFSLMAHADQTVTVTATNADISESLDLKMVATLFGQAEDLEQFEQMLNNPDSAFSNLDLNGDGNVDYLRVIETADQNRHLIVIQAVLAKDIYQDVASIFVDKDEATQSVTVQVIGDEYIYGTNYIIEPVYLYRPVIYDWFWGPHWVAWHSPFYWDYWPTWWHPYHCMAYHMYWDHMYWYHHHYPVCTYRPGHHHHPHYAPMREHVSRSDYATRHPERSFAQRHVSTRHTNARDIDRNRHAAMRTAAVQGTADGRGTTTRVSNRSIDASRTYGSTNVRTNDRVNDRITGNVANRTASTVTRTQTTGTRSEAVGTRTTRTSNRGTSVTTTTRNNNAVASPSRSSNTRSVTTGTRTTTPSVQRATTPSVNRSSSSSVNRSSSSSVHRTSTSTVRSSGASTMRPSMPAGGGMRTSGGGSSRSSSGSVRR